MKRIVLVLLLLILSFPIGNAEVFAIDPTGTTPTDSTPRSQSPDGLWSLISHTPRVEVAHGPRAYRTYALDEESVKATLGAAPMEHTRSAGRVLSIPMPDGSYTQLRVQESPILSPELQTRHPEIRTYIAQGVDEPNINGRLDHTPAGFHAMLFTPEGMMFVNPNEDGRRRSYRVYWKSDVVAEYFQCGVTETEPALAMMAIQAKSSGDRLRTYDLALNTTGEYTTFFGGQNQALAAATTSVNRINGIYEREVAIRMQLVYFHAFPNASTDPYTDGDPDKMTGQNQTELDARVAAGDLASYDIGHVFGGVGGGGMVYGSTCGGDRGRGATSDSNPQGDAFDVDYAAHEIGHQFGGSHTWSGLNCDPSGGQFIPNAAMEPGSGTTIMSYAGVCGGTPDEDIQPHSDPFFHTVNFDEMTTFRDNSTCGTWSNTGNLAPSVNAGNDCTVPQSTPFVLSASGSDPDGDPLTYAWEQFDAAPAQVSGYPSPTATTGPLFRSRVPVLAYGSRFFPNLDDLIADTVSPWEVLPAVDRTLHFRVTARDNRAGGGGVNYDSMAVNVSGAPFRITSPQPSDMVECGAPWTITWDVGGGSIASEVLVELGIDAGIWNLGLVQNTGSFTTPIHTGDRTQVNKMAWIGLIPSGDFCFFTLSKKFRLVDTKKPTLTAPATVKAECVSPSGTPVNIGTAAASDTCDDAVKVTNNAPPVFPLGTTNVLWTATDYSGNQTNATQVITVQDTVPPTLTAPAAVKAECVSPSGTPVNLGTATASDTCDDAVEVTNNAPPVFPLGTTNVLWTATDYSGNQTTATQVITVQDTVGPVISCNAPETILPSSAPISFASSSSDACYGPEPTTITHYDCYGYNQNRRVDRAESCVVKFSGNTISILNPGGVGDNVDWTVVSVDGSGNTSTKTCHLVVVKKK